MCCNCFAYFCGPDGSKSKAEMVWPAFVWNMLLGARTFDVWGVIPISWRGWWVRSVNCDIPVLQGVTLEMPLSLVVDVSVEVGTLSRVLKELKWEELQKVWGELCFVPYV